MREYLRTLPQRIYNWLEDLFFGRMLRDAKLRAKEREIRILNMQLNAAKAHADLYKQLVNTERSFTQSAEKSAERYFKWYQEEVARGDKYYNLYLNRPRKEDSDEQ